jgi:two-component system, NtrC family, response regulator GlrR
LTLPRCCAGRNTGSLDLISAHTPPVADPWLLTTEPLRTDAGDHRRLRRFRIVVEGGPDSGAELVSAGERAVIGTHDSADLRLTDRAVSRFHCELELTEREVVLADLHSRNGTAIDGVPVLRAPLRHGALIAIGTSQLRFQLETDHVEIPLIAGGRFGLLVGASPAMRAAMAQLARVAASNATILLDGETGTGKELAAESVHREGPRRDGPFLVVDCGAIPADLLDGELFGHTRGAFTGAESDRAGVFESASGGTVLLDEIGELPPALQPKLLRVLERKEIRRIGEPSYRPVDVRIIAATHRDLRADVNGQRFRADLFYRLAVVQVRMPPLRERREDLPLLVDAILEQFGMGDHPLAGTLRAPLFREGLAGHAWPGNVRELRNYIERCLVLRAPMPPSAAAVVADPSPGPGPAPLKLARERWLRVFEHAYLADLLKRHDGNVSAAARSAGVDRIHLYRLLWRNGLR